MSGQISLTEQAEVAFTEHLASQIQIINCQGEYRFAVLCQHERIGKANIQFSPEQTQAQAGQRMIAAEFDHDQVQLGDFDLSMPEAVPVGLSQGMDTTIGN